MAENSYQGLGFLLLQEGLVLILSTETNYKASPFQA
jgi:hypothetical protein